MAGGNASVELVPATALDWASILTPTTCVKPDGKLPVRNTGVCSWRGGLLTALISALDSTARAARCLASFLVEATIKSLTFCPSCIIARNSGA